MPITALYALPLTLLLIALAFRTIGYRRANRISLGDGDNPEMLSRIRTHGNCAEYAPLGIILLGLAESNAAPALLLHAIGITLVVGRISHAYGLSQQPQIMAMRVSGMVLTFTALAAAAVTAAALSLQRLPL